MNKMNKLAYVMRLLGRNLRWVVLVLMVVQAAAPRWRFNTHRSAVPKRGGGAAWPPGDLLECGTDYMP